MVGSYSRWKHRITYSLSPVTTVADRWVTLILPWRVGIRADYADIRFSDTAGNALSYNIASKTDRVTATIKIRIPTAGIRLIHCYFGNSQAACQSTTVDTEDSNPVLTPISGTTNPEYLGNFTRIQEGRLNQQGYTASRVSGPYPQWKHKALIKITNPVSQTNYQHKLTLTWLPGMRSDFRDIRVSQINGKKCDYWIESYTSRTSAVVWIEVPTAGQRWLNLHYGNGRAINESNGENVFLSYEGFEGLTYDFTLGGTSTISSTYAHNGTKSVKCPKGTSGPTSQIIRPISPSGTMRFIQWAYIANTGGFHLFVFDNGTATSWRGPHIAVGSIGSSGYAGLLLYYNGSAWVSSGYTVPVGQWVKFDLVMYHATSQFDIYVNDTIRLSAISYGFTGTGLSRIISGNWNDNATDVYFDDLYQRLYATTEPTLTLVSHQPNSTRIIPYETIGEQPTGGNTYVMDPIEFGVSVAASMGPTILQPVVSFAHSLAVTAPVTKLTTEIDFGYTIAGSVISRNYIPLDQLDLTQISVSKAVSDDIWAMSATIDGYQVLNTDVLRHATFATTDHNGVSRSIFAGIIPKSAPVIKHNNNKTTLTGFDYAWYLAHQKVQSDYQHNTASVNPADIIAGILGGDNWEETTGIMPYKINQVAGWGTTLNSRVFDFTVGMTKKEAIAKICNYCRYVFIVKWIVVEGVATPAAYFISEDAIDTELDLPDPVTFTYPDPYLADSIKPVIKGDERYNRVTVIGRNNSGGVFSKTVESDSVKAGDELAVEYIENSGSWTTQDQVDARAQELFDYYSVTAYTYTATADERMDLELLQKIKITGYTGVSENWMRITKIKKEVKATNDGVEKTVDIEFTENVKWSALRRMYRYASDDLTSETETIVSNALSSLGTEQVGVVSAKDGSTATVTLEDGTIVSTRAI